MPVQWAKAVQLLNPLTGAVFGTTTTSILRLSTSRPSLYKNTLPATTDPCGRITFLTIPSNQIENQFIGRVDATLTQKHSLYGRYFLDGYGSPASFSPTNILVTAAAGNQERVQTLTVGETWVINPQFVNTIHATGTRRRNNRGPVPGINANTVGVNIFDLFDTGFQLSVTGKWSIYCGTCSPGFFNVNTFSISDDVTMTRGKHQIAFGGEFARSQYNSRNAFMANGNFGFSGTFGQKRSSWDEHGRLDRRRRQPRLSDGGEVSVLRHRRPDAAKCALTSTNPESLCTGHLPRDQAADAFSLSALAAHVLPVC